MTTVIQHPDAAPRNSSAGRHRVLVAGPQSWTDSALIHQALDAALALLQVPLTSQERLTLIHGGAPGLDTLAAQAAAGRGWDIDGWPARWGQFTTPCAWWHLSPTTMGACTDPAHRSYEELTALHADLVIAFPLGKEGSGCSKGTWRFVRAAAGASLPVFVLWKERLYPCGQQAGELLAGPAKLHKLLPVAF